MKIVVRSGERTDAKHLLKLELTVALGCGSTTFWDNFFLSLQFDTIQSNTQVISYYSLNFSMNALNI